MSTTQKFLKTLKTAKKCLFSKPRSSTKSLNHEYTPIKTLLNSIINPNSPSTPPPQITISSFLSSVSSNQLHSFLSNPKIKTCDCLRVFNLVLHNHSQLSFKPDFHAHLTLICRLIRSMLFSDAEILLEKLFFGQNYRYPFSDFTIWVEKYCNESKVITKLLNMLLVMYSDNQMFDMVDTVFEYMMLKDVKIDAKTCSVHVNGLVKSGNVDLGLGFLGRMIDSGVGVSVFSWTIVVSGLCEIGELKLAIELVEEMIEKGVKPNGVTFHTLVGACARRWRFEELDMVLCLMEKEQVQFDGETYTLLIEGYAGSSKVDEAERLLLEMEDKGFKVDMYLYLVVIRGYCRLRNTDSGLALLRVMQENEIAPCDGVYQCLISCMCKVGEMDRAKELVDELLYKGGKLNDTMYNTVVEGYQKAGMMNLLEELKCMLKCQ